MVNRVKYAKKKINTVKPAKVASAVKPVKLANAVNSFQLFMYSK